MGASGGGSDPRGLATEGLASGYGAGGHRARPTDAAITTRRCRQHPQPARRRDRRRRAGPPPTPATATLRGPEPASFLGYIHAMERHAIRIPSDWFGVLEQVLPTGVDAASGLRAHATELDLEHVEEAVAFFATLPARDRTQIVRGC